MREEQQMVHDLILSYRDVHHAMLQTMQNFAPFNRITFVQLMVISVLARSPGLSLRETADAIRLSVSTTSGIIERMVRAELVIRERGQHDRRSITLRLSEKGAELWQQTADTRQRMLSQLSELPDCDRKESQRINQNIVQLLQRVREVNQNDASSSTSV